MLAKHARERQPVRYRGRVIPARTLLEPVVRLRLAIQDARDPRLRAELREVETSLRRQLGPCVPKRASARLLGISVTALDRWIDRGFLPVVAPPGGSTRLALETGPLLELATRVRRLRSEGRSHAVVAAAVRELGWRAHGRRLVLRFDVACLPRPNTPLEELQREYAETTPRERVLRLAALTSSLNALTQGHGNG